MEFWLILLSLLAFVGLITVIALLLANKSVKENVSKQTVFDFELNTNRGVIKGSLSFKKRS